MTHGLPKIITSIKWADFGPFHPNNANRLFPKRVDFYAPQQRVPDHTLSNKKMGLGPFGVCRNGFIRVEAVLA